MTPRRKPLGGVCSRSMAIPWAAIADREAPYAMTLYLFNR